MRNQGQNETPGQSETKYLLQNISLGHELLSSPDCYLSLHENKNFRLTKICEKDRKDHIFISFRMFPFHGNIIFSELSFKRKCKKAASFRKCVFLRKYEIFAYNSCAWRWNFLCRFVRKTSDFSPAFRSIFRLQHLGEKMKFPTSYCS